MNSRLKLLLAVVFILLAGSFLSVSKAQATTLNLKVGASGDDGYWGGGNYIIDSVVAFGQKAGPTTTNAFLRFTNVTIPRSSNITSAVLGFTDQGARSTTVNVVIKAVAEDNPSAPTSEADANGRSKTTASVAWPVEAWPGYPTISYSVDLSTVIQELVNRAGWNSGNSVVIYVLESSSTGYRDASSYDNSTSDAATLSITYAVPPTITSPTQTSITATGATLGGNVTSDGGASITARGVCYSVTATNSDPQIGGTGVTCTPEGGTTTGVFTEAISGLSANTAYTFNAYATNSVGTSYIGSVTADLADTTDDGVVLGGGFNVPYSTARSTSVNSSIVGTGQSLGQYYVLYDTEPPYTDYSTNVWRLFLKFDTAAIPDSNTITQANMTLTSLVDSSTTDFDVQIVKLDWSAQDPIDSGNREAAYDNCLSGTADDNIWRNTSGMSISTQYTSGNLSTAWVNKTGYTYYCLRSSRDYANTTPTNSESITVVLQEHATSSYRPVLTVTYMNNTFTTLTAAPTITTPTKTPIHGSDATLGGNVTSDGGATVTGRGVCVGASADPALGGNCFSTSGTTGTFTVSATGLTQGTLYHYRAYATNSVGTSYTTDDTFTTLALNNYLVTVVSPQAVGVCVTGTNTLTARDSTNTTITTDSSTVNMTSSGTGVTFYTTSGCSSSTTQYTMSSGTANIYYKTNKAQSFTVTATKASSTETGTSSSITVNAGSQTRLVVTLPGQTFTDGSGNSGSVTNQTVNGQFTITSLTATDDYFNVITGYSGAKTLVYAGPTVTGGTTYTTAVNFTSGVSTTTLYTILTTAQTTTITVTDGGQYGYASSNVTVNAESPPGILIK